MKILIAFFRTVQKLIGFTTTEYDRNLSPIYIKVKSKRNNNFN